jgi:hypothetical protein
MPTKERGTSQSARDADKNHCQNVIKAANGMREPMYKSAGFTNADMSIGKRGIERGGKEKGDL